MVRWEKRHESVVEVMIQKLQSCELNRRLWGRHSFQCLEQMDFSIC